MKCSAFINRKLCLAEFRFINMFGLFLLFLSIILV